MSELTIPECGMRVRVDGWVELGTIVEIFSDRFRVEMDGYEYPWDGDAHSFPWERCEPADALPKPANDDRMRPPQSS